jgi:hypothetical protein
VVSRSIDRVKDWPPVHRCANCGWWKRHEPNWFDRLLVFILRAGPYQSPMGFCRVKGPNLSDQLTAQSYVCRRHTASAYEDITPSLERFNRAVVRWL